MPSLVTSWKMTSRTDTFSTLPRSIARSQSIEHIARTAVWSIFVGHCHANPQIKSFVSNLNFRRVGTG
eukprot:2336989-Rhodomonas_salina.2